ncbi:hypothetical protein N7462_010681 [Penicillium macrosclerotiorum]|uniref:uncharacterized protein n=1 Tax=Penicillium macrosclerotiorum TaxID=303699 RepID=UPI00254856FC|nr:uncharacterized protein N7462_010681 [Penicillium macrosclerotiorum]KAJ5669611.1 hypothetical protein N7462_010681 [Penicillium macrosclerotiorum]
MSSNTVTFKPTLILHGGAGNIKRETLPPDFYAKHYASLQAYLRATYALLKNGSTALDAAVHAVSLMEDDELFNCGRGSVFTTAGTIEMEASVMVTSIQDPDPSRPGEMKRGVGVIGVRNVRHPIYLAREHLLRTGCAPDGKPNYDGGNMHAQLAGPHVETLAREWGLEIKPDEWFWTQRRWDEHRRGLSGEAEPLSLSQGTVGCVCLDQWGNLAVATSTGGKTNKLPGRVGDTPTLGAGFWAEAWDELLSAPTTFSDIACLSAHNSPITLSKEGILKRAGGYVTEFALDPPPYSPHPINSNFANSGSVFENQGLSFDRFSKHPRSVRRAIAVSGTGDGDSFLRLAAARTIGALAKQCGTHYSLHNAVEEIAGRGGQLQHLAGGRWSVTGEGEGGIIGIEATQEYACSPASGELRRGQVVWDFNCGGMWRAWIDEQNGEEVERIMVFREEYK